MEVIDRIAALRRNMKKNNIDLCIITSSDYHQSEYIGEYFKVREYMTGFTGSAGTAVFTQDKAGLWTDGRYYLQAADELNSSGISLYKSGMAGTISVQDYIKKELPDGGTIGFDGRTTGVSEGKSYEEAAHIKAGTVISDFDPALNVWTDRPQMPCENVYSLELEYSGEKTESKMERVREYMKNKKTDIHILASLDDIAWLLNLRGSDIKYCPLFLSYMIIFSEKRHIKDRDYYAVLYADSKKFPNEVIKSFLEQKILLRSYNDIYKDIKEVKQSDTVMLDPNRISYSIYKKLNVQCKKIEVQNPEILMKSIKNDIEIKNIRNAHLKDAVACIKFIFWLKQNGASGNVTELSASEKLERFRSEQEGYLGASFAPICAFGSHGAIVHYSASESSNFTLKNGGLFLCDTGGHYMEGSTDITRTIAIGDISINEKENFTLTARAMLRLMNTVFLYGCNGQSLDCMAREVFWREHVNFNHGTGHGVGYLLNIHEPPISFRWKESSVPSTVFEKNMIITDEPGIYIEGSHGVRLENELLVCEDINNEYGTFMHFEPLTYVPIDLDALIPEKMTAEERNMLNDYHAEVYHKISGLLADEEREWLKEYTRPV